MRTFPIVLAVVVTGADAFVTSEAMARAATRQLGKARTRTSASLHGAPHVTSRWAALSALKMVDDPEAAKMAAAKAKAAKAAKAKAAAPKAAPKADAKEEDEDPEAAAKAEAEAKKKAEEEAAKKKAEAEKKAKAAAEKKAKEEAKAAAEKAEAIAVFSDQTLVLTDNGAVNPNQASVHERAEYLRDKDIAEASIQAAMKECGVSEVAYQRDAWGRIIAKNSVDFSPFEKTPPSDAFGQRADRGAA